MRKVAATLLAIPVIAILYIPVLLRRSVLARVSLTIGVGVIVGIGILALGRPTDVNAVNPSEPIVALTNAAFQAKVGANVALLEPVQIRFSAPMDPTSVAASVRVEPPTELALSWNDAATELTIEPASAWLPGTLHTITVDPGALATNGRPTTTPARAIFVTRRSTVGQLSATETVEGLATLRSGFRLSFDRPVSLEALQDALTITPTVEGSWQLVPTTAAPDDSLATLTDEQSGVAGMLVEFVPSEPLTPGTTYSLAVKDVVDRDGGPVAGNLALEIQTLTSPGVKRFRPASRESGVDPAAVLSVRFTQPMHRASTKSAFAVLVGGKAIPGTVSFAENNTVLVFRPSARLPWGTPVTMVVGPSASAVTGGTIGTANSITFRTKAKPVVQAQTTGSGSSGGGSSGGGSVGGGSWAAVETYYLGLMNCTRTGGWVDSGGHCDSPGGRNVAALRLDSGISSKVARPYAKLLATRNACSHFLDGNPGNRLSRAGYRNYRWAENIGCRSGNPRSAVLGSHLFFQAEKSSNGGHWVNMMNPAYDRVGIGVWVSGGRVRLVIDFYHP